MSTRLLQFVALLLVALGLSSGCASYSDNVRQAHKAVAASRPDRAAQLFNQQLKTQGSHELPASFEDDNVLLLLERATVLQAMGKYKLASRDMIAADDQLEWLDIGNADSVEIAKYMYSGSSEEYRAPAYERLLLNTLNMINFLALRDLGGAKVEARRFAILEQFFVDQQEALVLGGILALGNYLGATAFEHSGDYEQAARYYSRAWYYGIRNDALRERLVDLFTLTGYKPRELQADDKEALTEMMEAVKMNEPPTFKEYREKYLNGDTLVLIQTGLVPWKQAVRMPIASAMTYTSQSNSQGFSPDRQARLNMMVANGVIESVNFPMLTDHGLPQAKEVVVQVGDQPQPVHNDIDVASQVRTAYAEMLPTLMVAAITRLMTRVAAGKVTEAAVNSGQGNSGIGFLAGLAVQGAMNAADTPDTRSWMTLPGRVRLVRMQLGSDVRPITVTIGQQSETRDVTVRADSLNVVNFSRIR